MAAWLAEDRALPGMKILRRAHETGYAGGKSALYGLIRRLRPTPAIPVVRFEGVHFFASRLKWSRAVDVRLLPNEQEEALVRALLRGFEAFGGGSLVTVWDNPKTVVQARQGDVIVWNAVFSQVALDYRFAPELCWPRAAQQKGAVEQLVGWVKRNFFACRRFLHRAHLEQQLTGWLTDVNTARRSRATGVIPAVRLAEERARLRPLPIAPDAYALKLAVVVSALGRVRHAGLDYSMPADTIGQTATLYLYEDRIEIVTKAGALVRHPRRARGASASLLPEHPAAPLARVHGARGQLYFQRQSLWELGPDAEAWLIELVHRRPARWRADVEACFALWQDCGPTALPAAFASGVRHRAIGAGYVRTQLATGMGAEVSA